MTTRVCAVAILASLALAFSDATAEEGFEQPREIEEITVYGTPPSSFGLGTLAAWLSWSNVDTSGVFGGDPGLSNVLNQFVDALNEASEQHCQNKIEQWRSDCHAAMNLNAAMCAATSAYGIGTLASRIPTEFKRAGTITTASGLGGLCAYVNSRAHANCDVIADSDAAPRIAQCSVP